MSEKTYVKSGYWIKWKDRGKTYYRCCCKEEDLPSDPKIKWHCFYVNRCTYWSGNYYDYDLYYSALTVRPKPEKGVK